MVALPQHFYINATDVILPEVQTVADGSWVIVAYINQSSGPTISLQNTSTDGFAGVSVGASSSTAPITLSIGGEVIQFVSAYDEKKWFVISRDN